MIARLPDDWQTAADVIAEHVRGDKAFPRLVVTMAAWPTGRSSMRLALLSDGILERIGLDTRAYRATVYALAARAVSRRRLT